MSTDTLTISLSKPGIIAGWISLVILLLPTTQGYLHSAGHRWFSVFTIALGVAWVATPLIRQLAFTLGALDCPDYRKTHKTPTPLLGGLAVYLGFLTALAVNTIFDRQTIAILVAGSGIMAISVCDDIHPLSAKLKLAVQIFATTLVIWAGVSIQIFPRHGVEHWISTLSLIGNIMLTFLWIVGITNAMNFLDGMDGLATGLSAVIALFLCLVSFQTNQPQLGWFALAMLGACLGFLPYNFRPHNSALIFLGDAGSTFMGFTLACLGIRGDWSSESQLVSVFTPTLLFGVLIFDMIHTTIARIYTGKVRSFREWVDYVGRDHIHHRLQRLFQCRKKAVLFILAICGCLGISAVIMRHVDVFHATLLVVQGSIGFLMFSTANFFQERTFVKIRQERDGFRIQECLDITLSITGTDVKAILLDISANGAKILVPADSPIDQGINIIMAGGALDTLGEPPPNATVVWKRAAILDENIAHYTDGFCECGIQFSNFSSNGFFNFVTGLHQQQITERRKRLLKEAPDSAPLAPTDSCHYGTTKQPTLSPS